MTNSEEHPSQAERQTPAEKKELDATGLQMQAAMKQIFPEFSVIDTSQWEPYNPTGGEETERRMRFYKGEKSSDAPQLVYMEKKDRSLVMNFYNNPHAREENRLTQKGGSIYAHMYKGDGENWASSDVTQIAEASKIWLDGIVLSPEVIDQPMFIMEADKRVVTLRSVIEGAQKYKKMSRGLFGRYKRPIEDMEREMRWWFQAENIYTLAEENPDLVKTLVIDRLSHQAKHNIPFFIHGQEFEIPALIEEIHKNSLIGQLAQQQEVMRIGIQHELLWQNAIIHPGPARKLDLPPESSRAS